MALTPSTMLELGTPLPSFDLVDAVSGRRCTPQDFDQAKALVVMFLCNHCPFVVHVQPEITRLLRDYRPRGVAFVGINSNDVDAYPQDAPEHMRGLVRAKGWDMPFLHDETQEVAKAFRAACTPDVYVFDQARRLFYRGRIDASRPESEVPLTGADLRGALDALLEGRPAPAEQSPSVGCNIKWKPGNEPEYFG